MLPHLDLEHIIRTVGLLGVAGIIFAETGLFVGFFLPGDSLLFTAGLLASQGVLDVRLLVPLAFAAAVAGDALGYMIGRRAGRSLFRREGSFWFRPGHLRQAEAFFARYGGKAVGVTRFLRVVRTFVPVVAGAGAMRYRRFVAFNVVGALLWAAGVPLLGYSLGAMVPGIDRYLTPLIGLIVLLSVAPTASRLWRGRRRRVGAATGRRARTAGDGQPPGSVGGG